MFELVRTQSTLAQLKEVIGALGTSQIMRGRGTWSAEEADGWRRALDRVIDPARLQATTDNLPRWHEKQATMFEKKTNWFAARFHYRQLQQLAPANTNFASRLTAVEEGLRPSVTAGD